MSEVKTISYLLSFYFLTSGPMKVLQNILENLLVGLFLCLLPQILISQDFLISDGGTISTCSGDIYDSGGSTGDYGPNEDYIITVCPQNPGECVQLDIQFFTVDEQLIVYDGPDQTFPVLYDNNTLFQVLDLQGSSDCLTIQFISNGTGELDGFVINISCATCFTCTDGIQNGSEDGIDCGGSCPPCPVASPQDCIGAQPICDDVNYQPVASNSEGNFPNEVGPGNCLTGGEANSIWYIFTMGTDGDLSFTLEPDQVTDDYDWVLFNITDASCEDIPNDPSLLVSCNSWGDFGANGQTGMSSSSGGTGNSNGPGSFNGPPFNADEAVLAGETFALMISDWSGTPDGYTLDFSESTAELFDLTDPTITDITANCQNIDITFSENIDCASLDLNDFLLTQGADTYNVTSIESACSTGELFDNQISLTFTPSIPDNEQDFTFSIVGGFGSVTDLCGNQALISDTALVFNIGIDVVPNITNASCNEPDGSIDASGSTGGLPPYTYILNGLSQSNPIFNNLAADEYLLVVVDDIGCSNSEMVTVAGTNGVVFDAGLDDVSCSLDYNLQAVLPPGFTGEWSSMDNVTFTTISSANSMVTSNENGLGTLTWTIDDGIDCLITGDVAIFFTQITSDLVVTNALCQGVCDGEAELLNPDGGLAPYVCSWADGISSPNACLTVSLCPGSSTMTITDGNNCQSEINFLVEQTSFFEIDSLIAMDESCVGFCDGEITVYAANGFDYSIDGGSTFLSNSTLSSLCNGEYEIIARDINLCEFSATQSIASPTPPYANFTVKSPSAIWSNPVFETVNLSENYIASSWEFGFPNGLWFSQEESPILTSPTIDIGFYEIQLIIENEIGCTDSTNRTVEIKDDVLIFIPSSFSPNEDGVNDIFKPIINDVKTGEYSFIIYNRFGNVVFESMLAEEGWNGEGLDNKQFYSPNGVYNWHLIFTSESTLERFEERGSITLIR
ncbi:MAG: gliding motility-associated-like protein [Glaciecola sp.]